VKKIEEIKEILIAHKGELKERFGVKEFGIFGSYIKGTQKDISDLDILVEFESPIDFFTFLELEEFLTELLGVKVDLVMRKALKPEIGKHILREVLYV